MLNKKETAEEAAMFFYETEEFRAVIDKCSEELFLRNVCSKYHYRSEDMEQMRQIALMLQEIIKKEALFLHTFKEGEDESLDSVVMTLGEGIDRLQDSFSETGELTSAYMVEILSGEILLLAYTAYNEYMAKTTPYHVARYCFPGSEKDYPLTELPQLLLRVEAPVICNESCCMIPRQSVAFFAQLTKEEKVRCRGICMDCKRMDCPNRINGERLLPYGYARILGKEFL